MGITIEDGLGTGSNAGISPTGNRLNTSARQDGRLYYVSRDNGDAYTVFSIDTGQGADEHPLYFKNTSTTQKFYVSSISVAGADLGIYSVIKATGTATGVSALTPVNLNLTSGNTASATVRGDGDVTGFTPGVVIANIAIVADSYGILDFHDALVLGQGDAIAVHCRIGGTGESTITLTGFFDIE